MDTASTKIQKPGGCQFCVKMEPSQSVKLKKYVKYFIFGGAKIAQKEHENTYFKHSFRVFLHILIQEIWSPVRQIEPVSG